ncbi:MAG: ATPase domain-containing protein [Promethearchaeota archaeon]
MILNLSKILNKNDQHISTNIILEKQKTYLEGTNILPSGLCNLDNILNGGFYSKKFYIIFGKYSTGKTQLCHQLCVESYKKFGSCIFIDTENTFRPERIVQITKAQNLNPNNVLKSILVTKILSNSMFILNLQNVEKILKSNKYKVILIDSINNYYRVEQSSFEISYYKAKTDFLKILNYLNDLINSYNLITIGTAQVSPNFINDAIISENPVGIQYLDHYYSEFLYLTLREDSIGTAHLVNSFSLPEKKGLFEIKSEGIKDRNT